jgi:cytochrome P450
LYSSPLSDYLSSAITLSSIFYFLLKNPRCYKKLRQEIENLQLEFESRSTIPFAITKDLPYLDAVVNESLRCHNISRLPTSRLTPPSGMAICGKWIPGGVEVGVYGPVMHHRKEVFGKDVDVFRPERWLDDEEKVRRMRNTLFSFGSGKYSCLGKNLSRLELLKVIPELIRTFEVSLRQRCTARRRFQRLQGLLIN